MPLTAENGGEEKEKEMQKRGSQTDMSLRARCLNPGPQAFLSPGHGFRSEVWHFLTILRARLGHYSGLEAPEEPLLAVSPAHPTM